MHDLDFEHEHELGITEDEAAAIKQLIEEQDTLDLLTVGIDIGSSTSHLLFAKVVLRRRRTDLSSRFEVVDRQVIWASPIIHTPFRADGLIDAHELSHFIIDSYAEAGLKASDVDSGAVILTGEAIKRPNARAIDEIFASQSGKFVCATAGHELESLLAAHGSGATRLSRERGGIGLHVDIGGGTTKLALLEDGEVIDVAAFAVGGRLLAHDAEGRWTRIDDSARLVADDLGIDLTPETAGDPEVRRQVCERLAEVAVDKILGADPDALGRALELTGRLERRASPSYLTFSGGVSEYVFGNEVADYGDIARELADQIVRQLGARTQVPAIDAGQRIRATVIGASQYTVQVSGTTIFVEPTSALPLPNVPVLMPQLPLDREELDAEAIADGIRAALSDVDLLDDDGPVALAYRWEGSATFARLDAFCRGVSAGMSAQTDRGLPLVLVGEGDVGGLIGIHVRQELGLSMPVVSVDGLSLKAFDFIDVGELLATSGAVPVVIKSLVFPNTAALGRPHTQGVPALP